MNCAVYYVNTKEKEINKVKTIIVNTSKNISLNFEHEDIELEEIKKKILEMPDDEYNKLVFTNSYQDYLNTQCIIIAAELSKDCFSSKSNLILCGCRNIYTLGGSFFCRCSYEKCGVVCERQKNHFVLNLLILFCLAALLFRYKKEVKCGKVIVNRNIKHKVD